MKNSRTPVVSSPLVARSSAGGTTGGEARPLRGEQSPEMMELLGRMHSSKDFSVASALRDFAGVVIKN